MVYNILYETECETVVAEYKDQRTNNRAKQSEKELEEELIENLKLLGYEYINIKNEEDLINNLRYQLENLNNYKFDDEEWKIFFKQEIKKDGILEKATILHDNDCVISIKNDEGFAKNIKLIDKKNIHNNKLQVINQYRQEQGIHKSRYDVTILVNGLPIVHIELKRRGENLKEAFNQIERYQYESFWAGSSLFEFVQIFVISNGTDTKYYSNTVRNNHVKTHTRQTSDTFEFTIFWSDALNHRIADLVNFTHYFFARNTILNIITKYCVFTDDKTLLVMRPYQIVACERILNKIKYAENNNIYGTTDAGGYIWHTTGSGKTLTSFKTSQLASKTGYIDKVLFVVDRKDLDYQTIKEYEKFQKGCVSSNTNTKILQKQIEQEDNKIIVTTIQKLSTFIKKNKYHEIYNKKVVLIFDECHRSQFGLMHANIIKSFKKYSIFGFTGTPIFQEQLSDIDKINGKTTEQVFGKMLHSYTIINAIYDETVLPFKIEYHDTFKSKDNIEDKKVIAIDTEEVFLSEKRITKIAEYILEHFDIKTQRNSNNNITNKRQIGFNSILAVSSIEAAKKYYSTFKKLMENRDEKLKVATIFSYSPNKKEIDIDEEGYDVDKLNQDDHNFLESAINDYNKLFGGNYSASGKEFDNYYKDLSKKVREREIDLLIVVNMFLTGFDAKTLNTLWIDKYLKFHTLIQAFSRTNRILNSVKKFGNIICFRNLVKDVEEAVALYGDERTGKLLILKDYKSYFYGYEEDEEYIKGYIDYINDLYNDYPNCGANIIGEENEKEFIKLFGVILKLINILSTFDDFQKDDPFKKENKERDFQDYKSRYLTLHDKYRKNTNKESIIDDIVFEIELIKQVDVDIDYILKLVQVYFKTNQSDRELKIKIEKIIDSSILLRNKKDLIKLFIENTSVKNDEDVYSAWQKHVDKERKKEIMTIINEEKLKEHETLDFIKNAFRDGEIRTIGTEFDNILPAMSRFNNDNNRNIKKNNIIDRLTDFFNKYIDVI